MAELTRIPCPDCGEANLATDTVCLKCGRALRVMPRPSVRGMVQRARLPMVSGRTSALVLAACFGLSGVLIPVAAHLPRWVEFELVFAAWWIAWVAALSVLLFRGWAVDDDPPPARLGTFGGLGRGAAGAPDVDRPGWGDTACCAAEGCLSEAGLVVVALLGAWLVVEFVVPAVALLAYLVIRRMLAAVVNDDDVCKGRLGRSVGWALWYATLFTAPLAFLVWVIHAAARHAS